jgi:hypothetical protein
MVDCWKILRKEEKEALDRMSKALAETLRTYRVNEEHILRGNLDAAGEMSGLHNEHEYRLTKASNATKRYFKDCEDLRKVFRVASKTWFNERKVLHRRDHNIFLTELKEANPLSAPLSLLYHLYFFDLNIRLSDAHVPSHSTPLDEAVPRAFDLSAILHRALDVRFAAGVIKDVRLAHLTASLEDLRKSHANSRKHSSARKAKVNSKHKENIPRIPQMEMEVKQILDAECISENVMPFMKVQKDLLNAYRTRDRDVDAQYTEDTGFRKKQLQDAITAEMEKTAELDVDGIYKNVDGLMIRLNAYLEGIQKTISSIPEMKTDAELAEYYSEFFESDEGKRHLKRLERSLSPQEGRETKKARAE